LLQQKLQGANILNIEISDIAKLPSVFGEFLIQSFKEGGKEHLVVMTPTMLCETPIVRVHSECLTGDALGSLRCDCRYQLNTSLETIHREGCGMVIYLRQEGRGIGLFNKVNAYKLQDGGLDTYAANHQLGFGSDERNFEIVEKILTHYGISRIKLLTNNPKKLESIKGVEIVERIPIVVEKNEYNSKYIEAKKAFGHLF
jgi:GTP cyclohydrolase II